MRNHLFDTMVLVAAVRGAIPEKWRRQWNETKAGRKHLLLFEPLIAEMYYTLAKFMGEEAAQAKMLWLKSLRGARLVPLNDNLALGAARTILKFKHYGISLVDAFSITIAKREGAELFTTDLGVRNICKEVGVPVSFLPSDELTF